MGFISTIDSALKEYKDELYICDNDGTRTMTYEEFNVLSGKVSEKLISKGIKKGDAVVISMERNREYVAAEYGVIRLGGTAIPVIPSYPEARVSYIKKDSGTKLVITEDFFEDIDNYYFNPDESKLDVYNADPENAGGVDLKDSEFDVSDPKRIILYTSGSTGNPKGVIYRDKAMCAYLERSATAAVRALKPFIYSATATMSFAVTITEYYRSIIIGGHVHIISDEVRKDIAKIEDYYEKHQITMGFLSPRMAKIYKNKDKALKVVITGSERVVNTYSDEFTITNGYGQTETCGGFCKFKIDKPYENTPVGKPLGEVKVKIVDENGNEVADGEEGLIVAIGIFPYEYNNLPEQSAKTFEKLEDGMIAVHTGDRGRILPDGNLLFVNRNDWMLKIHGQRVEPGEIEAVMNETKCVNASAVKGFELEDGSMLLCAFYTGDATKEDILKHVEEKLPHYMVPGAFVKLDAFPINPNGKVDRTALKKPDLSVNKVEYEAPENDIEKIICKAMEEILDIDQIGRNDDFYALGGNSLNAVRLVTECDIKGLSAYHIMVGKTPKGIALQYEKNAKNPKPEFKKYDKEGEYPLTLSNRYNIYDCEKINETIDLMDWRAFYELDEEVDISKLKKAIEDSLMAHQVYGININKDQSIIRNESFKAEVLEITVEPEKFEEFRRNKAYHKRDMLNDQLFDIEVIHVGTVKTFLYMNMTHQIFDGAAIALLYEEISQRYEGKTPEKEIYDIFDVSKYEEEVRNSSFYDDAVSYFDNQFKDLEAKDFKDTVEHQDSSARKLSDVDLNEIGRDEFLKKTGVSDITYIQAAICIAVSKAINQRKFTYKILHSGRDISEYNDIHGSIARGVYMLTDIDENLTVKDYLNKLQDTYQETVYYDVIPMKEIATKYPAVETEIYINYRGKMGKGFHLGDKRFQFLPIGYFFEDKHIEALLNFQIDELPNGKLSINLGAGFFSQEKTNQVMEDFEKALLLLITCENMKDIIERI